MLKGLEKALEIVNSKLEYCKSFNAAADKSSDSIQHNTKFKEAYITAFEEMKISLEAAISIVKNGERPDPTSIIMDNKNEKQD